MGALVMRGFLQRKLRVALTAIAIALGVALMAGTYVLTDTINHSFAGIFQVANRGNDAVITPAEKLGRETRAETSPITEAMLAQVRSTPGVAQAAGAIFTPGNFLDVHGKRLTNGGAPAFVATTCSPSKVGSYSTSRGHGGLVRSEPWPRFPGRRKVAASRRLPRAGAANALRGGTGGSHIPVVPAQK